MAENNPTLGAAVWKAAWVALILTALGVFMMPPGFTSALEIVGTALGIFVVALVGIVVGGPLAEQARDSEGRIQVGPWFAAAVLIPVALYSFTFPRLPTGLPRTLLVIGCLLWAALCIVGWSVTRPTSPDPAEPEAQPRGTSQ